MVSGAFLLVPSAPSLEKFCPCCATTKPTAEFFVKASEPDGFRYRCKPCEKGARPRVSPSPCVARCGRVARTMSARYCDECFVVARRMRSDNWKQSHPEANRALKRRVNLRRYGLTPEAFDALLGAQGNACASCGDTTTGGSSGRFHVDHDHTSGAVRGLLCQNCNIALGMLRDDPERIAALGRYLGRYHRAP